MPFYRIVDNTILEITKLTRCLDNGLEEDISTNQDQVDGWKYFNTKAEFLGTLDSNIIINEVKNCTGIKTFKGPLD